MCLISDVSYHVAIKTGNVNGASSDSKVFVKLYGEKCDTNKMILAVTDNDLRNYFETGRTDIFTIETFDVGRASPLDICTFHREANMCHVFLILFYLCPLSTYRSSVSWLVTRTKACRLDGIWTV